MVARVSRLIVMADQIDAFLSRLPSIAAHLRTQAGFVSLTSLVDRSTGECVGMTVWEDEDAERASRAMASLSRGTMARAGAVDAETDVTVYEVTHHFDANAS